MPRSHVSATYSAPNPNLLPPWATLAAIFLEYLGKRVPAEEMERRIRIERKSDACDSVELLTFLIAYFASGLVCGLRPFWRKMREWSQGRGRKTNPDVSTQLASLVGKRRMCSSSSASRALAQVKVAAVRPAYEWLLIDVPEILPVLQHPAVLMRDTLGEGLHVFDVDGSTTPFCHRDLAPASDDMPEGERRTGDIAAPGYAGRKRADVQCTRAILSHAGSGAWLYARLGPGNGDLRGDLEGALDTIVAVMARIGEPVHRCVARLDGAYGNVPAMTAAIERGVPFVTRASQNIMSLPEVQARLAVATWEFVPGAEVDGMRSVAELGMITLEPSEDTLRTDGTRYAPITVRAVVSRIRQSGNAGRGVVIDGWQYEVFLTLLVVTAWPAAEVVANYQGRSTCENRYAQEDRELRLDRVLSYHPDGQELATVVGMMVWNMQIAHGYRMSPPPTEPPVPQPRIARVDDRPSTFPDINAVSLDPTMPLAQASEAAPHAEPDLTDLSPSVEPMDMSPVSSGHEQTPSPTVPTLSMEAADLAHEPDLLAPQQGEKRETDGPGLDGHPIDTSAVHGQASEATPELTLAEARNAISVELKSLPWTDMLENRPGWRWDQTDNCLRCPDGQALRLVTVRFGDRANGQATAFFATTSGSCRDCPIREQCFRTTTGRQAKQTNIAIPADVGQRIRALLNSVPRRQQSGPRVPAPKPAQPHRPPSPPRGGHRLHPPQPVTAPGPHAILHPPFLPAEARRQVRALADQTQIELTIHHPDIARREPHSLLAATAREKRRGRTSRTERRALHSLPPGTKISLNLLTNRATAAKLLGRRPRKAKSANELRVSEP